MMATVKLNTDIRSRVKVRLLRHRFSEEVQALAGDFLLFAEAVYADVCKDDLPMLQDGVLRPGMLPVISSLGVQFGPGSGYQPIYFNGNDLGSELRMCMPERYSFPSTMRPIPHNLSQGCAKRYENVHPLSDRYFELRSRKDELGRRRSAAEHQIDLALQKATTVAKLVELWPEVRPFVADMLDAPPPPPLPAIPVAALNKTLDLPVDEEKRAA